MKPLVSVIITTKNEEKYLESCLKSVKNQSYPKIEIIVTDACSNDNTVKIAKRYAKVIEKETNIAQGKNLGAKLAKGEFLIFLSADTALKKNWIENALKKLKKKDVAMVVGLFSFFEKSLSAKFYGWLWRFITIFSFKFGYPHVSGECTLAVKTLKFHAINGFREDLVNMEDVDSARRIKGVGDIALEKKCWSVASARRFEKEGYIKWSFIWLITGIWYYLTGKSPLREYKSIR